jgi:hypothetical protein
MLVEQNAQNSVQGQIKPLALSEGQNCVVSVSTEKLLN